jgi:hypothetical protein
MCKCGHAMRVRQSDEILRLAFTKVWEIQARPVLQQGEEVPSYRAWVMRSAKAHGKLASRGVVSGR